MKRNHIAMVDFWSVCDENAKPIGHGVKAGNEYYEYIKDNFEVTQYVNDSILPYIHNPRATAFSGSLEPGAGKMKRILSNYRCLKEVYQKEKDSLIWFYVPDIYLFLFILLMPKGKRRLAVNVYEEYAGSSIKRAILRHALRKTDLVFVTGRALLSAVPGGILIPDYAYREETYGKYAAVNKKEQAVCLGTMNEKKQLAEAVKVFSGNKYPLHIVGQFASKEKYEYLCRIKGSNVTIEDRYVDSDEYYSLLASSRYCLVPYDAEFYKNRTSGVMQECLFTDTIPLSHRKILEFTNIAGIGYDRMEELAGVDLSSVNTQPFYEMNKAERERFYQYGKVKSRIVSGFKSLETATK